MFLLMGGLTDVCPPPPASGKYGILNCNKRAKHFTTFKDIQDVPLILLIHLLCLFARLVVVKVHQVNHSLSQELVQSHLGSVHDHDVQRAPLGVVRVEERQVKRGFLFPHRSDASFGHRGGELVLGHLDDRIGVVGAILALDAQATSLVHRYLDAGGEPLLALIDQRHRECRWKLLPTVKLFNYFTVD